MSVPNALIVEFAGLPGAGKSTFSHAVAERLHQRGARVSEASYDVSHRRGPAARQLEKLRRVAGALVRRPLATGRLLLAVSNSRQASWRDSVSTAFNLVHVCALIGALARRPGVHLLDQGLYQAAWSVGFRGRHPQAQARIRRIAGAFLGRQPADLVVWLEVAPQTSVERMRGRPGGATRLAARLDTPEFGRDLAAALAALEDTRALVGKAPRSLVIPGPDDAPGRPDFEAAVERTVGAVLSLWRPGAPEPV